MANLGNLIREDVSIYLAETGTSSGNLSSWLDVGWCQGRQTRLDGIGRIQLDTNDGLINLAKEFEFKAVALQTDRPKLLSLEALVNKPIDILMVSRRRSVNYKLSAFFLGISPNFVYTIKDVKKFILRAKKKSRELTDLYSELHIVPRINTVVAA